MALPSSTPQQQLFVTLWGVGDRWGWDAEAMQVLDKVKSLGYTGIETTVAHVMKFGSKRFLAAMKERGLKWIAQVFSSGPAPPCPGNLDIPSEFGHFHLKDSTDTHDVKRHCEVWAGQVLEALELREILQSVNSHTGKDYFTPEEADKMFHFCVAFEKAHHVQIQHETHRSRILYSPWVTKLILPKHPDLKLTADYSHFSVVCEADCDDPELKATIQSFASRVVHVHARVGFNEGPQVPDPRAPAFLPWLEGFTVWWDAIYDAAGKRGAAFISTTPEFGPPPYAWVDPNTNEPLANMWEVNHFIGQECSTLFAARYGEAAACHLVPDTGKN